jgi:hypothetical protein
MMAVREGDGPPSRFFIFASRLSMMAPHRIVEIVLEVS